MSTTSKYKRIDWIDVARGLCIILVVICHGINGYRDGNLIPENGLLSTTCYFIYTFHMAAFFVLSGIMAPAGIKKDPQKFFNNLARKIAYPYFLWGITQILVMNLSGNLLNHPSSFDLMEFLNLIWGNVSQFWFLKTLFLVHLLYLAFRKYGSDISFLLLCIVLRGCLELFPMPGTLAQICGFGIFYALGAVFSQQAFEWPSHSKWPVLWGCIFGVIWLFFAAASFERHDPIIAGSRLTGSLLPASVAGILFIFALSGVNFVRHARPLRYIGQRTLAIYLLHVFFVAGTRIFMTKALGISNASATMPVAISMGLLGPLIIVEIADRLRLRAALGLTQ